MGKIGDAKKEKILEDRDLKKGKIGGRLGNPKKRKICGDRDSKKGMIGHGEKARKDGDCKKGKLGRFHNFVGIQALSESSHEITHGQLAVRNNCLTCKAYS